MTVKVREIKMIPVAQVFPNDWNPNEQTTETFNGLVEEIKEDGFEGAINVVPWPDHPDAKPEYPIYKIIGGEHRWRAAKVLGMEQIPAFVHADWDEKTQKLKTVRRNLLTGGLNDAKFTALVKSLQEEYEIPKHQLPHLLGFDNEAEFSRHVIEEKDKREKTFLDALLDDSKKDVHAVDALTDVISTIFAEAGDTIDQSFLHFTFKGSLQTVILLDKGGLDSVKKMVENLRASGVNANLFIKTAIDRQLSDAPLSTTESVGSKVKY